ncbi:MAG: ABC transporter ATP-binding protein, partial [Clostridium sp.]|nr:ABC transporter ATP-binding protein [Clostridium sp.]
MEHIVEFDKISKSFGKHKVVDEISFTIEQGELFGLLGPNGAGKSTTISMLSGLIKPSSGNIFVNGKNIEKYPQEGKKSIGLVPQDIALYPTLSAQDNLFFWGRMYGLSG